MKLGWDYVILSSIIIVSIIPVYIYRKKLFKFAYKKDGFTEFIKELKLHLKRIYPKFQFDYSIISKTSKEKDSRVRQSLVVENIISQLIEYDLDIKTQDGVTRDKLWTGYDELSKNSSKKPSDWKKRRELVWNRDKKSCIRCTKAVQFNDSVTLFVSDYELGGGFNVENLYTVCTDCNQILNKNDSTIKFRASNLEVYEDLYKLVDRF